MRRLKDYYDYFSIEDNKLARNIEASHKKYGTLLIYKEYVDGKAYCRNLYTTCYGGYCVLFPGDIYSKYCSDLGTIENWGECNRIDTLASATISEADKVTIELIYPDFKYVLKKWQSPSKQAVMRVIPIWQEHKEVETLLAAGLENLVFNKSFWRLSKPKRTELRLWLKENKEFNVSNLCFKDIQTIIKYKITFAQWQKYIKATNSIYYKLPYTQYRYLITQGDDLPGAYNLYKDYKDLLKQTEHNLKDPYWREPKDLRAFHDKVLEEVNQIKMNREKAKFEGLPKALKRYLKFNSTLDDYYIFFSTSQEEWYKQAEKLHQCIVRCDYMKRVTDRRSLIAFITKDGEPIATAEIQQGKKINQFYTDEWQPNYHPSEELKAVFNKWLETLPNNILQKRSKKSRVRSLPNE